MRLRYENPPLPGTIIRHLSDNMDVDVMHRFHAVDYVDGNTAVLRVANPRTEVYVVAQPGGREPQSIVEFHILRRMWTPYGFAKVHGSSPACLPPALHKPSSKPRLGGVALHKETLRKHQEAALQCALWWEKRRPSTKDSHTPRSHMKEVNRLYKEHTSHD